MRYLNTFKQYFLVYLLSLITFTFIRLILLSWHWNEINQIDDVFGLVFKSLIMGFRFDTVIICYILVLPFLVLSINELFIKSNYISKFFYYYVFILLLVAVYISVGDIPYFNHFYNHLTIAAFNWLDSFSFMFTMILEEWRIFYFYSVIFGFIFFNI